MPSLTVEEQSLLPNDDDVAFFRAHGYWLSPKLIPDDLLEEANRAIDRFYRGQYEPVRDALEELPFLGWRPGDPADALRKNDYASFWMKPLHRIVTHPVIAAAAARLVGTPEVRLWHDQLLSKPPETSGVSANVGWHSDRQYWLSCSSDDMLTAWVPFQDVNESTGTIRFLDGSNRWEETGQGDFWEQDLGSLEDRLEREHGALRKVAAALRRGQVSFHHCRTMHGSTANLSAAPRRALAIHLQPAHNRYRHLILRDGSTPRHTNNVICRRHDDIPDYTDPRWCPTLWRDRTLDD